MKIIDKVKYKNIFEKVTNDTLTAECFICSHEVKSYFITTQISTNNFNLKSIYVCLKCGKTEKRTEKVIIPLFKIMYGGIIDVVRFRSFRNRNYLNSKWFYY